MAGLGGHPPFQYDGGAERPNDMRISCGRSWFRPHKPTLPQRLHRRVPPERHPAPVRPVGGMRGLGGEFGGTAPGPPQQPERDREGEKAGGQNGL